MTEIEPILTESGMAEAIEAAKARWCRADERKREWSIECIPILDAINRRFLLARTKLESAKQWTNPPRTQQLIQVQLAARRLAREFEALEGS